jgi:Trk-type K+ transport system membrane component
MLLMYFGRVGILSITYAVMVNLSKNNTRGITYPDANMLVG